MLEMKELIRELSEIMSISGSEYRGGEKLRGLIGEAFDEYSSTPNGNHVFIKRCKKENAPLLMLDAHFDEIGMIVRSISDDGFIGVMPVGGLDSRILLGGEVIIYADEALYGVCYVKAVHLHRNGEGGHLPEITELQIQTGYSRAELEAKGVRLGTPVGFKSVPVDLLNSRIAGKGFDDKCCVAAAAKAVEMIDSDALGCDVALLCSCKEEIGMNGGKTGAFSLEPDACIVLDVNLAHVPETDKNHTIELDEGPGVSLSAVTDRSLTRALIDCAKQNELKCQTVVEATSTGTNANIIQFVNCGIPTAVLSIPLRNMHTYSEVISIDDCNATSELLAKFITGGFEKWMNA